MPRIAICFFAYVVVASSARADWLGFRGDGSGVSSAKGLPDELSEKSQVWKVKLPGLGASSPIVVGDRIFLTCYSGYGAKLTEGFKGLGVFLPTGGKAGDQDELKLWVVCFDRAKGDVVWKNEIKPILPEAKFASFLREHGYASSTPVSDGVNVYVFFGKTGVIAFDLKGQELWRQSVGEGIHEWGSAASPALAKTTLVVNASIESSSLVGLDKRTGKELWRRKDLPRCWTSPVVVDVGGKQEVVMNAPGKVFGLDPETGAELWTCKGLGGDDVAGATCSTPAVQGDVLYMMSASPTTPASTIAVKAGGRGDVTATNLLWKQKVGAGICSPIAHDGRVYFVDGVVHCLNAADGKVLSRERLYSARGEYPSPVLADGKIFAPTRFDGVYVLSTDATPKTLSHNPAQDDRSMFNATPAIADGQIYLRSNEYLYRFGKK